MKLIIIRFYPYVDFCIKSHFFVFFLECRHPLDRTATQDYHPSLRPLHPNCTSFASQTARDSDGNQGERREGGAAIPEFHLCAALVGHAGDVRSLAVGAGHLYSGARDKTVMAWELDKVCQPLWHSCLFDFSLVFVPFWYRH